MKPICKLVGIDGNIFSLLGKTCDTLRRAGMKDEVKTIQSQIFACASYNEALNLRIEYVEVQ